MGMVVTRRRRRKRIAKKGMNIENLGDDKDGGWENEDNLEEEEN